MFRCGKIDVKTEPPLIPLTGEELNRGANKSNEARLDVSANGFWTRGDKAFFDVRIFNPFALKHRKQNLEKVQMKLKRKNATINAL